MLGENAVYDHLPYFYSDQYDIGMEYTGFVAGPADDEIVISGSLTAREFVAFWKSGGLVRAGMAVNSWDRMPAVDALIRSGAVVSRAELTAFHG
jgi:3-phenylpropionate/trans-cinnamate dioxygenase ferredoxin reductase subunit